MGTGASAPVSAALSTASDDDVKAALTGLPADMRDKLTTTVVLLEQESSASDKACTFLFLRADKLRERAEDRLLTLQAIRQKHPDWLVSRRITFNDCCTGELARIVLAVSHRWESVNDPDPLRKQLAVINERLVALPDVELVWIDYSCMPQGKRTETEHAEFTMMLPHINLIYLAARVLVIMDSSYFSRFWTLFEAWLATQEVTAEGLRPATAAAQRCHIECIHQAVMKFDGEKLKATWVTKTPQEAYEVLSSNDITVTNTADKEAQLPKLLKLNEFAIEQHAAWRSSPEAVARGASAERARLVAEVEAMKKREAEKEAAMKKREAEMKKREAEMEKREAELHRMLHAEREHAVCPPPNARSLALLPLSRSRPLPHLPLPALSLGQGGRLSKQCWESAQL